MIRKTSAKSLVFQPKFRPQCAGDRKEKWPETPEDMIDDLYENDSASEEAETKQSVIQEDDASK